ncbi:zinc-binding alcohol dehydrogenase family protein [Chitinophaga sp. sic0106]|uniref:zinc-binding alcohol dehydrogenase family protein n=1 Tax=Chitinophaga sp. sic0106 TaxID=2854785 RepID=UPI001C443574|nr:zinc-binding alcohol dehydrogenase family protein [Chitinophaga sp. sic0106]MBV7530682.1 zinc-binding alcohol dehydrogenase family protein [Chitinophaga sp. sic0106]
MKAIGFKTSLPINEAESFILFETPTPTPAGHDILVKVQAASVNPVDYKIRQNSLKDKTVDVPKVIGWDAAGIVEAVGEKVTLFKKGDYVYYAGDFTRDGGANQEYQLVDERIVGFAPNKITLEQAAAMPLTALTAYEILFDRLRLSKEKDAGKSVLIIGGAGGVGSVAIQLAKKLLNLKVIATASRPDTIAWCQQLGADLVVNHRQLEQELNANGYTEIDFILDFVDLSQYWDTIIKLLKPQGQIGSISDPKEPVDLRPLKRKSGSFHWELMFTRPMYKTPDMIAQHHILNKVADLLNEGTLVSTLNTTLQGLTVENLKEAHRLLESGTSIGKLVIRY